MLKVLHVDPDLTRGFLEPQQYHHLLLVKKDQPSFNVFRFVFALPDAKSLLGLPIGDEVEFRGPKGAMCCTKGLCRKLGMVAGGTGITPMYWLIWAICENETDTTEISLIYANRSESDILLRTELENLARRYPKNLEGAPRWSTFSPVRYPRGHNDCSTLGL